MPWDGLLGADIGHGHQARRPRISLLGEFATSIKSEGEPGSRGLV